ncbi:MAG: biotin/lipoyl-binding protein [Dinoroseobacter sp.]|nr:biotin/lipoyl-binding protein [Dinoroseobacter sp.]
MIELFLCGLVTVLPDYLFRRYRQGKRLGHEITIYSVWYELRWGITSCAILAAMLITVIFYFHPSTSNVTSLFRTVAILSERTGRVTEVYVENNQRVSSGDPIFKLDTSEEEARAETARRQLAEIEAQTEISRALLSASKARLSRAEIAYAQALEDLDRRERVAVNNRNVVSEQELERARSLVLSLSEDRNEAVAEIVSIENEIDLLLPARREVAEATLEETRTQIAKSTIYAGVNGVVQQFQLRVGDVVNPLLRPAGVLVADSIGEMRFQAGFDQISATVLSIGMLTEVACSTRPLEIFPMVVADIQPAIAAGQYRASDQLVDVGQRASNGTILAALEPVFEGHTSDIPPGSSCKAVAYSNHREEISTEGISGVKAVALRIVDGLGITNALIIRIQATVLPFSAIFF